MEKKKMSAEEIASLNGRHYFGELGIENGAPVQYEQKYHTARIAVCRMIEESPAGLLDEDFYIQKKRTQFGGVVYSGLVITHAGCQKLAQELPEDNRIKPECFHRYENVFNGSLIYEYVDENTYQVGEVSSMNCSHPWPYAMAFKRCYDRVVLEKTALSASGVHSVEEADDFNHDVNVVAAEKPAMKNPESNETIPQATEPEIKVVPETRKAEMPKVVAPEPAKPEVHTPMTVAVPETKSVANAADQVVLATESPEETMSIEEAREFVFTKGRLKGKKGSEITPEDKKILAAIARTTTGAEKVAANAILGTL